MALHARSLSITPNHCTQGKKKPNMCDRASEMDTTYMKDSAMYETGLDSVEDSNVAGIRPIASNCSFIELIASYYIIAVDDISKNDVAKISLLLPTPTSAEESPHSWIFNVGDLWPAGLFLLIWNTFLGSQTPVIKHRDRDSMYQFNDNQAIFEASLCEFIRALDPYPYRQRILSGILDVATERLAHSEQSEASFGQCLRALVRCSLICKSLSIQSLSRVVKYLLASESGKKHACGGEINRVLLLRQWAFHSGAGCITWLWELAHHMGVREIYPYLRNRWIIKQKRPILTQDEPPELPDHTKQLCQSINVYRTLFHSEISEKVYTHSVDWALQTMSA